MHLLSFHHLLREFSIDSLSFPWIHFEFNIFYANSLWIHYQLHEFTMDLLSFSRIHYDFTIFIAIFTMNSLLVTQIHYGFIIFFATSLWFYYIFRGFIKNSLSVPRIHNESIILFANGIIILRNYSEWSVYFAILFIRIFPRNHCGSFLFYVNSLCFYYHFRKRNINWLSISRNYFEFVIFFANILLFHYLCCEFTMN